MLGGDSGTVPKSFDQLQQLVLTPMCAEPCHKGGAAPKGLSLESGRAVASLVNVPSVEAPGMMRVAPGQPDASWLLVKVAAMDSRRVGARMPRNGPPFLTSGQVAAVRRWIQAGARADWIDQAPASPDVAAPELAPPEDDP